jgi:hypothetical protein
LRTHRRHVYEHNGGGVDEKDIADSGDTSVRLRQEIHESQASTHRIIGFVAKMAENLHSDFHDIFPPEAEPVRRHAETMKRHRGQRPARKRVGAGIGMAKIYGQTWKIVGDLGWGGQSEFFESPSRHSSH